MIDRFLNKAMMDAVLGEKKIIVLYGPRQSGKTTLLQEMLKGQDFEYFTGDDLFTQDVFSRNELAFLRQKIQKNVIVIDEAQKIDNIATTLKLLSDNLQVQIITSGSASFDLANKFGEALTGRTKTFFLYPMAYSEIKNEKKQLLEDEKLSEMLRFGMYPKIHTLENEKEKESYLYEYLNNYLYKDLLMLDFIKKPKKIVDLLTLLALQIGKEVSNSELAQRLAINQRTVEVYLDILEKMFILINIRGFSRNLRKEISKTSKYFFVDIGIRNALIRNFNPLNLRNDVGEMFENWFIIERIKASVIFEKPANFYFWRTYDQQEIDLIEERAGKLTGYEVKWSFSKKVKAPRDWLNAYQNSEFVLVNQSNYTSFLGAN